MNKATIKSGVAGALGLLAVEVLLIVIQESVPSGSPLWGALHVTVFATVAPIIWVWESLGVRGDAGLLFVVPIFASTVLYLAGIGFLVGAGFRKLRNRR